MYKTDCSRISFAHAILAFSHFFRKTRAPHLFQPACDHTRRHQWQVAPTAVGQNQIAVTKQGKRHAVDGRLAIKAATPRPDRVLEEAEQVGPTPTYC